MQISYYTVQCFICNSQGGAGAAAQVAHTRVLLHLDLSQSLTARANALLFELVYRTIAPPSLEWCCITLNT